MLKVDEQAGFRVRGREYDETEVVAHIAALEERIAQLEAELIAQRDEVSDVRLQAFRVLTTAREDAEAMVDEARQHAAEIIKAAHRRASSGEPYPLDPRLEVIKAELSAAKQRAFTSVARRRHA